MAELTKNTSYNDLVFARRMEQYKNSPILQTIIEASNEQADDVETALFEVRDLFYLPTAEGVQLNTIGFIFKTFREYGETDASLRNRIQLSASARFSGTPEEIMTAVVVIFGGSYANYTPLYPAGFTISTDVLLTTQQLEHLAPAGVGIGLYANLVDAVSNDIVDANNNSIYAVTLGF